MNEEQSPRKLYKVKANCSQQNKCPKKPEDIYTKTSYFCKVKVTVFDEALQTTNEQGFSTAK